MIDYYYVHNNVPLTHLFYFYAVNKDVYSLLALHDYKTHQGTI